MAAYVIVTYDIVDAEAYPPYVPAVVELLHKHRGEILVADFDAQAMEGTPRSVNVVIKFPSEDAARAWHTDPEYEPAKSIRLASCDNNYMVLAKEFVPPSE